MSKVHKWYLGGGTEVTLSVEGRLGANQIRVLQKYLEGVVLAKELDGTEPKQQAEQAPKPGLDQGEKAEAKEVYTITEVAKLLNLACKTVRYHIVRGNLPLITIDGKRVIQRTALERYLVRRSMWSFARDLDRAVAREIRRVKNAGNVAHARRN